MNPQKIVINNHKQEKIVGEFYKSNSKSLIIVCHGLEHINNYKDDELQQIFTGYFESLSQNAHASLFSFDFRGHGESDGEKGITLRNRADDIKTVIDYFISDYPDIILYGYSFGAMSAVIQAVNDIRVKKIILINGFFSFSPSLINATQLKMITLYMLTHPLFILEILYWKKQFRLKDINHPTLVVCAENDATVGSKQSKYVYQAIREPKKLLLLSTNDHMLRGEIKSLPKIIGGWIREQNNI